MCSFEVFSIEEKKSQVLQDHILHSQPTQLWFYIIYTVARWVKVSVLDQFWPSKKPFTVLLSFLPMKHFNGNLITCCWGERKSNLKTDWPFLFSLQPLALTFPSTASHSFTLFLANICDTESIFTLNLYSLRIAWRKGVCVYFCVSVWNLCSLSLNGWVLQWISSTGR